MAGACGLPHRCLPGMHGMRRGRRDVHSTNVVEGQNQREAALQWYMILA